MVNGSVINNPRGDLFSLDTDSLPLIQRGNKAEFIPNNESGPYSSTIGNIPKVIGFIFLFFGFESSAFAGSGAGMFAEKDFFVAGVIVILFLTIIIIRVSQV